ncbi:MFS transporter [Chitinimonas sp. BJB300]|uniref:MFS transporter n=1 Tax=Chitinimonas sp. BJB300 TaxID=1559339 RepID=UPI000C0FAD7A|nr:MFS transporter [Chitinimonas sp. BJB300]PHV11266.1 MFS transporter [Chitinimonas sp. BJB300]TSJ90795.1 MHS family MFS transporter [Chitinimonas sp. BJB300]
MNSLTNTTAGVSMPARPMTKEERKVIFASSLGTVFEWYDFYLYGSLAAIIASHFFAGVNDTTAFIFALMAFAAGFAVRPFGALVFGRLGDMIGRKYTFLITILIMGLSTAIVGLLPSYATIGISAPIILIILRLLQGLALGGEYGGAATYVAEHAPHGKRGLYTSFIQTTATMGLFLSLLVIWTCRNSLGTDAFKEWGWRIPFLISLVMLAVSVYIRMQLNESPAFKKMKEEGKHSKAPLTESFLRWPNLRVVLLSLFGGTAGQAVVWYTGQFYALFFLTKTLGVEADRADLLIAISLAIATPGFILFGALSDKIGRKKIIMAGCFIAAISYFPIFKALTHYANPALEAAVANAPVKVIADPAKCTFQFDPIGKASFKQSCDIIKSTLAKKGIPYSNAAAPAGTVASVSIGNIVLSSFEGEALAKDAFKRQADVFNKSLGEALKGAGYPAKSDLSQMNTPMVIVLLTILVLLVTMVYGPIAAWLVELFPTKIRYTSMSLPYHIGNGWFGGFLPTVAFAMVAATGDIYYGLWYPIGFAIMTFVVGTLFAPETKDRDIYAND